jgi:hypothetical protein
LAALGNAEAGPKWREFGVFTGQRKNRQSGEFFLKNRVLRADGRVGWKNPALNQFGAGEGLTLCHAAALRQFEYEPRQNNGRDHTESDPGSDCEPAQTKHGNCGPNCSKCSKKSFGRN